MTLLLSRRTSTHRSLSQRAHEYPHTHWTRRKERVQRLFRSLVPGPAQCVEVRPNISSWYSSTSRNSSCSFPAREVTRSRSPRSPSLLASQLTIHPALSRPIPAGAGHAGRLLRIVPLGIRQGPASRRSPVSFPPTLSVPDEVCGVYE